jgi:hypothetical protein
MVDKHTFIDNKYTRWYYSIIDKRVANPPSGYFERHHTIPKCMGGNNNSDNIVCCTGREHFILHALLIRMTTGPVRGKLAWGLHCMSVKNQYQQTRYTNSRLVGHARSIAPPRTGFKHTDEYKANRSGEKHWFYGKKRPDHSIAMSGENSVWYGVPITEKTRVAVIKSNKARAGKKKKPHDIITCNICGKSGGSANMKRYHFNNCKELKHV